jgi:hypothetical protein
VREQVTPICSFCLSKKEQRVLLLEPGLIAGEKVYRVEQRRLKKSAKVGGAKMREKRKQENPGKFKESF